MTTIIIEDGEKLPQSVFKTVDDFIEEYYANKGLVILHQINFDELSLSSQEAIEESKKMGNNNLIDFKG